jgi:RNA polymerase sigma factor (sigma-70 family)
MTDAQKDWLESLTPEEFLEQKVMPLLELAIRFAFFRRRRSVTPEDIARWHQRLYIFLREKNCRRLQTYNHQAELLTWLQKVASREINRFIKSERRIVPLEEVPTKSFLAPPVQEEALLEIEYEQQLKEIVRKELTPSERQMYELIRQGLKAKEIAKVMGIEINSVYTIKSVLKKKLAEMFKMGEGAK